MRQWRRRHSHDRIERYLRRLGHWAPRSGGADLVAEARRHLYEATCRLERAGVSHDAAQRRAIRDFGPAWRIGLSERGLSPSSPLAIITRLIGAPLAVLLRVWPARRLVRARSRRPRPRMY